MELCAVIRVGEECPYRTDWTVRAVLPIARLLEFPILRAQRKAVFGEPHPLTVSLVLFLLISAVGILAAWIQGILLPPSGTNLPRSEYIVFLDWVILLPLGAVAAFSFYRRLYPAFDTLRKEGIIQGNASDYAAFKKGKNEQFNDMKTQTIAISLTLFWAWGGVIDMLSGERRYWADELNFGIRIWLLVWSCFVVFTLIYVWWKGLLTWWTILKLSREGYGLRLEPKDAHPDMCGGLSVLSNLWLRIHYLVVFTGIWVFGWAFIMSDWSAGVIVGAVLYIVFAPWLFVGPFIPLHNRMLSHRRKKIEAVASALEKAQENVRRKTMIPESIKEDMATLLATAEFHRKSMEAAIKLPTWPFNIRVWERFLASYCVPFIALAIDLLWRVFFGR